MFYLLKTEPSAYSYSDLKRDKETIWDGVTNATAVKYLRSLQKGDNLVIYHTSDERSAVGTAHVVSVDAADPKQPVVKIRAGKALSRPKTLADVKEESIFAGSPLVKQGRLSVVPLTEEQFHWFTGK